MNRSPKITVLMPVYNCELFIKEAIESILNQTYSDFEFLIIDDASTDQTISIIKKFSDPRIQLIEKPLNTGYTNSLNHGLEIARGEYIARMDGDDISLPERLEKQFIFMEANEAVVVCGTLYRIIGTDKICDHPSDHDAIKVKLISGCYIAHPTVMLRSEFIRGYNIQYDVEMEPAEDYDLWSRLVFMGKLANLNEVLFYYRVHENQTSSLYLKKQTTISKGIKLQMLKKLINSLTIDDLFQEITTLYLDNKNIYYHLKERIKLLNKLNSENKIKKIYKLEFFKNFIDDEKKYLIEYFYINKNLFSLIQRINFFFMSFKFLKFWELKRV